MKIKITPCIKSINLWYHMIQIHTDKCLSYILLSSKLDDVVMCFMWWWLAVYRLSFELCCPRVTYKYWLKWSWNTVLPELLVCTSLTIIPPLPIATCFYPLRCATVLTRQTIIGLYIVGFIAWGLQKTNSIPFILQANYADWANAAGWPILTATFCR
jgi:hypothetical protein